VPARHVVGDMYTERDRVEQFHPESPTPTAAA